MKLSPLICLIAATCAVTQDDIDWSSIRCPQSPHPTLPTPTYGSEGGLFTVCTELTIHAPPSAIYNALLDFQAYSTFSSFVIDVELPAYITDTPEDVHIGLEMTFTTVDIFPLVNTTSIEIVTVMENTPGERYVMVAWRYDDTLGGTFSRSEHPSILVDQGDGTTRYVSYETYYDGPGTLLLVPLRSRLQEGYANHGEDLKSYVESIV